VISVPQIDQVPSNWQLGILYQEEVAYCYQLVNFITFGLAQSDHIKRLPLYLFIQSFNCDSKYKVNQKEQA
jgi:hypothetical protein